MKPKTIAEFKEIWNPKNTVEFNKEDSMMAFAHTHHYGPWTKKDI